MAFDGRFADSLVVEQLHRVALSFLVHDLQIRRGGVAANIAFGLAALGERPMLVGAVGEDFAEYRSWLERHGVDCAGVHVSSVLHTARFICTTDRDQAQIASFYAGAMSEARQIELAPLAADQPIDLVLVGPNDPEGMLRHTEECRSRGIPFAADPSQQLARMDGEAIKQLIDGAAFLFSNDYEKGLIEQKTGWSEAEILDRVAVRVTTHGPKGAVIDRKGEPTISVAAAPELGKVDPTGVGDAFRAGFLSALAWGLSLERAAQVGNLTATHVLEHVGGQEYELGQGRFLERFAAAYGPEAAAEIATHVRCHHA